VAGYAIVQHPPTDTVSHGEAGIRVNRMTGSFSQVGEGVVVMFPGVHELRRYPLRDQVYKPERSAKANGEAPFQSSEGLSIGVELSIRYALDPNRLIALQGTLPGDIGAERVEPAAQGTLYKVFTKYTVREIFSNKRQQIQDEIEKELKPRLLADGIVLKSVMMGNVDLPPDYRAGMDQLLAVELESERMKYTLELKEKQVRETELQANSDKMVREKAAEAAGQEQVIAAKAQAEAMRHVIPFKQKQIEQRQLEAEADKRASSRPKRRPRRGASRQRAKPTRGASWPKWKSSGSTSWARLRASSWRATASS
jgi:regulator of protease activity HflC (stomatin/prohibitin superfamily)